MLTPRAQLAQINRMPAVIARVDRVQLPDRSDGTTWNDELIDWLCHLRISQGCSPLTLERYADVVRTYLAWVFGAGLDPRTMRHDDFDSWQRHLYIDRQQAERTRRDALSAVRTWYNWRVASGRAQANPSTGARGPRVPQRIPQRYSTAELRKLFDAARVVRRSAVRNVALLSLAYATGARRAELVGMDLDRLHLGQRVGRAKFLGKGCKEREVSFEGAAVTALRDWLVERDALGVEFAEPQALFVTSRNSGRGAAGGRLTVYSVDQLMDRLAQRAGLPRGGIHLIRSSYATDLFDQGEPLEVIQELLGHAKIETTRRYIVLSERYRSTRMASARLGVVIHGAPSASAPLWARKKLTQ